MILLGPSSFGNHTIVYWKRPLKDSGETPSFKAELNSEVGQVLLGLMKYT